MNVMAFTDGEKRAWQVEKLREDAERERQLLATSSAAPQFTCLHCQSDFGIAQGVVTAHATICDTCNY